MVDDAIPARGINRENRLHGGLHLARDDCRDADGGSHEWRRFVWLRRRVGTDVRRNENIPGQDVAFPPHSCEFQRGSQRDNGTIRVGDKPDLGGPRADTAQLSQDAERGAAALTPNRARDQIGITLRANHPFDLNIVHATAR